MDKDFIKIFQETKALMHGHFILSSGLHSDTYFPVSYTHLTLPTSDLV